eukprot:TRINITY_DN9897_c0_g7_i2.p1 TRINITY_DN9897_c0_g7~~TRINITY_DN9897_c0_g7_i2.p1  ORF type:complete len:134 (+),score=22.66 TRINITY_DN9897_c0_g7_i2:69-470(+)
MEQINTNGSLAGMNSTAVDNSEAEPEGFVEKVSFKLWQFVQVYVDRFSIYPKLRWLFAVLLLGVYAYRAYVNNGMVSANLIGFHVVTYFLGLYMLDKFLGFISPKDEEDVILPTRQNDEFRPFRRAVRELDLW